MSETSTKLSEKEAAIQALFTEIEKARENYHAENAQDKNIQSKTGWSIPADYYPEGHSERSQGVYAERTTEARSASGQLTTRTAEMLIAHRGIDGLAGYSIEITDLSAPGTMKPKAKEEITVRGDVVVVTQSEILPNTDFNKASTTNRYPLASDEAAPHLAILQSATESINTPPEPEAVA